MGLHLDYTHVFALDNKLKEADAKPSESVGLCKKANTLQYQLTTAKQYKKNVFVSQNEAMMYLEDECKAFTTKKKKWDSIPLYQKWNLVQKYAEMQPDRLLNIDQLKKQLQNNALCVTFDETKGIITNIE